ncbi:unnamed protein product [Oppiella nova]|uniref:Uncharacterized protein n=1 Tax=Oppiella nova TaxID=334625 RepID=A0A7R9MDY6_9ACAR|nr:unnamed protein product [Oppiella nova]CAG2175605.1 unnamed protein product [Oppiella nova]
MPPPLLPRHFTNTVSPNGMQTNSKAWWPAPGGKGYAIENTVGLEDYVNGDYIPRYQSRQLPARVLLTLTGVRYAISAIINTPYTRALLCDGNYMLGNPRLTSLMMSVAAFCILFIAINFQWLQNRRQLYICNFGVDLRRHQVSPPLSRLNY